MAIYGYQFYKIAVQEVLILFLLFDYRESSSKLIFQLLKILQVTILDILFKRLGQGFLLLTFL